MRLVFYIFSLLSLARSLQSLSFSVTSASRFVFQCFFSPLAHLCIPDRTHHIFHILPSFLWHTNTCHVCTIPFSKLTDSSPQNLSRDAADQTASLDIKKNCGSCGRMDVCRVSAGVSRRSVLNSLPCQRCGLDPNTAISLPLTALRSSII